MLSEKYKDEFAKGNKDLKYIAEAIIRFEKQLNKEIYDWREDDILSYLKHFKSISPVSLNMYLVSLRNFSDYICKKENMVGRVFELNENNIIDCIDVDALLSVTISYDQYNHIKEQLTLINDENVRDKLLFELAWVGLSNEEIKLIKETDITFQKSDLGWDVAIIKINDTKTVTIEDPEVVEDIKKVLKETTYIVETHDGRIKKVSYRDSEYLLKPINVGRGKKETYINNPGITLRNLFQQDKPKANIITCPGIDIFKLSIEDIKRSKMIYLLSNEEYFDNELIQVIFDLKNDSNLYWLKKIAKLKYANF